jgi:hypothetical protein
VHWTAEPLDKTVMKEVRETVWKIFSTFDYPLTSDWDTNDVADMVISSLAMTNRQWRDFPISVRNRNYPVYS